MIRIWTVILVLTMAGVATAQEARPLGENPQVEARLKALAVELRCLVCQNQTLADSNAPLAEDLRREVREMIAKNMSDQDIINFLVERYGDFVFYRPRLMWQTLLLWFGPLLFLLLGGWIIVGIVRRAQQNKVQEQVVLNEEEQARLRKLLDTVKDRD